MILGGKSIIQPPEQMKRLRRKVRKISRKTTLERKKRPLRKKPHKEKTQEEVLYAEYLYIEKLKYLELGKVVLEPEAGKQIYLKTQDPGVFIFNENSLYSRINDETTKLWAMVKQNIICNPAMRGDKAENIEE